MAQNQQNHQNSDDKKFDDQAKVALFSLDVFKYHAGTLQSQVPGIDFSVYAHHFDIWHSVFRLIVELCSIDHKQSIDYDVSLLRVTERTIAILAKSLRLGPQYERNGSLDGHRAYEYFEGDLIAHPDFRTLEARIPYLVAKHFPFQLGDVITQARFLHIMKHTSCCIRDEQSLPYGVAYMHPEPETKGKKLSQSAFDASDLFTKTRSLSLFSLHQYLQTYGNSRFVQQHLLAIARLDSSSPSFALSPSEKSKRAIALANALNARPFDTALHDKHALVITFESQFSRLKLNPVNDATRYVSPFTIMRFIAAATRVQRWFRLYLEYKSTLVLPTITPASSRFALRRAVKQPRLFPRYHEPTLLAMQSVMNSMCDRMHELQQQLDAIQSELVRPAESAPDAAPDATVSPVTARTPTPTSTPLRFTPSSTHGGVSDARRFPKPDLPVLSPSLKLTLSINRQIAQLSNPKPKGTVTPAKPAPAAPAHRASPIKPMSLFADEETEHISESLSSDINPLKSASLLHDLPVPSLQLLATQQQKDKANSDQLEAMGSHFSGHNVKNDENDNNDPDNDDEPQYTQEEIDQWLDDKYDDFCDSLTKDQREYFEYFQGQADDNDDDAPSNDGKPSNDDAHFTSYDHGDDELDSFTFDTLD